MPRNTPHHGTAEIKPAHNAETSEHAEQQLAALSDSELIRLTRNGEQAAYSVLWKRYQAAAVYTASVLLPYDEVQDVVSDAYLKVLDVLGRGYGPTFAFRPYLIQTVRNTAIQWHRDSEADLEETIDSHEHIPEEPNTVNFENRELLLTAFAQLPKRWQDVLWCTEVEGKNTYETGKELGISHGNVAVLAFRARAKLRELWYEAHLNTKNAPPQCEPFLRHMPAMLAGKLTPRRTKQLTQHLQQCSGCAHRLSEVQRFARTLNSTLPLSGLVAATLTALPKAPTAIAAILPQTLALLKIGAVPALTTVTIAMGVVIGGIAVASTPQNAEPPVPLPTPSQTATTPPATPGGATDPNPSRNPGDADDAPGKRHPTIDPRTPAQTPTPTPTAAPATPVAPGEPTTPPSQTPATTQPNTPAPRPYEQYQAFSATLDTGGGLYTPKISGNAVPGALIRVTLNGQKALYTTADTTGVWSLTAGMGAVAGRNQAVVSELLTVLDPDLLARIDPQRPGELRLDFDLKVPDATVSTVDAAGTKHRIDVNFVPGTRVLVAGVNADLEQYLSSPSGTTGADVRLSPTSAVNPLRVTVRYVSPDGERLGVAVATE